MSEIHPLYIPAPYQDSLESGRLILRDGSTATVRPASPGDKQLMKEFFDRMSLESRVHRFFSLAPPSTGLIETFCDTSNPRRLFTLVITRTAGGQEAIIGAGTYIARDEKSAEVALAVEDRFQRKGIGSHMLERLALLAIRNGFLRFWAVTHLDNKGMLDVFNRSGFPVGEKLGDGFVEVDFSVTPTAASVELAEMRDRLFTAASIRPFFKPNGVAVVGASRDPSSIGRRILEAIVLNRFEGPVYPVNPRATVVGSMPAYRSVRDLPVQVDLAVIAVPRDAVLNVVDDCAERGVRAVLVITAGFSEVGAEGEALQRQLRDKVRGYGMRMVGPNCLGLLNADPSVHLNASFSPIFPRSGRLAMSSQSGALGLAVLALAAERGLGFSTFVSVGNKADVSGNDLLQYWETDDSTDVILLYLESFGNPRRFARIARRVSRMKPIVAVKAGRTVAGRRAAGSHTAALAANDVAVEALFRQTGVIRAETLDEMFDIAATVGSQPLLKGRRIGIITNAGGPGILCTDACEDAGLTVPELSNDTKERLRVFLPATASVANPVDMIASAGAESYRRSIEAVLPAAEIDALVVIYIPVNPDNPQPVAAAIRDGVRRGREAGGKDKPVLACMMARHDATSMEPLAEEQIPAYEFPESAAKVLSKIAGYMEWRDEVPGIVPGYDNVNVSVAREIVSAAIQSRGPGWLLADEGRALLEAFGIAQAPGGVAQTPDQAEAIAQRIGFPVAVKAASPRVLHKTEAGGVRLNLPDAAAVRRAFSEMPYAEDGVLMQAMVQGGVELMIGVADDPLFGPLIGFGLGGIHVEILGDIRFRVTPLTDKDAHKMVREIRGFKLLEGYRGHAPADIPAIEEVLLRISQMVEEIPEIRELDLNPIFALPPGQGCCVVDARIRVAA